MNDAKSRIGRRDLIAIGGAALLWPAPARSEAAATISGQAFGTGWRVSGGSLAELDALRPLLVSAFSEIDRQMSPWRADSEVTRFNRGAPGEHVVSPDTALVARAALEIAQESRGAFDPTVGPLVARWGFGPIEGMAADWRGVTVGAGSIGKPDKGLTLDLCGIAKGWALDRAARLAQDNGFGAVLIDLGGELIALGSHPSGRNWRVAVEHPSDGPEPAILRLPSGIAVATSGLKAQKYSMGGTDYGHIIDPRRSMPASGDLKSVTVAANSAMMADGWATALFAAGVQAGPELARQQGISALFLGGRGDNLDRIMTGDIEALLT